MIFALTPAWAADVGPRPLVRLAVSEWPPFTGEHLPGNGIGTDTLRQLDLQFPFMGARALGENI